MCLSLEERLPITSQYYHLTMQRWPKPPSEVKCTSCDLRMKSLAQAVMYSSLIVFSPIVATVYCIKDYKSKKSNPLDVLIFIVISPIFAIIVAIQGFAGALIHPGINYRTSIS